MQHYHSFFTSTHFLESVSRSGVKELKALALDRSVVTIRCIEGTLAMADNSSSTSQRLINGILALICYNVSIESDELHGAQADKGSAYKLGLCSGHASSQRYPTDNRREGWHHDLRCHA